MRSRSTPLLLAILLGLLLGLLLGCGASPAVEPAAGGRLAERSDGEGEQAAPETVTLSLVGTSDLHGRVERVAVLGGFVANLRAARERDGGGVLLVDAGDMFQGTLESNLGEGRSVIEAYNVLGYHAAAVGNHEFDFGPTGPSMTPQGEEDDPRGALKARAAQAEFPLLVANILDAEGGARVDWPEMPPTTLVEIAGVTVGIVGVSTEDTPTTTIAANVSDLRMAPLADTIVEQARSLREQGADVVIVTAHAGGACEELGDPDDLSSCDADDEIFQVARALPPGGVDAIVAGHAHAGIAHRVNGIPVVEAFALGRAFARVDLEVDPTSGRVVRSRIHPPQELCHAPDASLEDCRPGAYEGAPVIPDARVLEAVADDLAEAERIQQRPSGVRVEARMGSGYHGESPLGNLLADLIRQSRPGADVALMNGGGIRAPLNEGELTYGDLYETFPFDNRFATVRTTVARLEALYARNLTGGNGFLSISGARVRARCVDGELRVDLRRPDGRPWRDQAPITVATSDFLATGGDGFVLGEGAGVRLEGGEPMREALFERLQARGGTLRPADFFDAEDPRVEYPGSRPVTCE